MNKEELSKYVGSKIKELRLQKDMTQEELAELTNTTKQTIGRYENGSRRANQDNLFEFADIFNVTINDFFPPLNSSSNNNITTIYNKLEPKRQKKVYNFAEAQLHAQNNKVVNLFDHKETVQVTAKVSAGTGITWLGDSTYDKEVASKPKHYDEAFEINGDSMIPLFKDGEIIFVEHTQVIENGQIAVVQIDEESFIKKVYIEEDKMRLVSLNKDYEDIIAGDDCDIRIVGKVIM